MKSNELSQNKTLAVVICLFLAFLYIQEVWNPYFNPRTPGVSRQNGKSTADVGKSVSQVAPVNNPPATVSTSIPVASNQVAQAKGYPSDALINSKGVHVFETEVFKLKFSNLGGRLIDLRLKGYRESVNRESPILNLVSHKDGLPYPLGIYSGILSDAFTEYTLKDIHGFNQSAPGIYQISSDVGRITFVGQLPDGIELSKIISIYRKGHFVDVEVELGAQSSNSSPLVLELSKYIAKDSQLLNDRTSGFVWYDGDSTEREHYGSLEEGRKTLKSSMWAAFSDKYFAEVLLSKDSQKRLNASLERKGEWFSIEVAGTSVALKTSMYFGPKDYNALSDEGFELQRTVDLGWASVIAVPLLNLLHFFYTLIGNYGLAIILLTIVVKTVLYPLSATSHKQMKAMQDIAPEMKRIQENVKDKQEQQKAIMALYSKNNVNPLGGCFPMLLQLPVFVGLYYGLLSSIDLRHANFCFWIKDLSAPEKLMIAGVPIPLMVILMVVSMLVVQWTQPGAVNATQKKMMMVIPFIMGAMFATFPAGLTLYFLTNNLISIGQTKGLQSDGKHHPLMLTAIVSGIIFSFAAICVFISG